MRPFDSSSYLHLFLTSPIFSIFASPSLSNNTQTTSLTIKTPLVLKVVWLVPKEINIIIYSKCACVCMFPIAHRRGVGWGGHLLNVFDKKQSWSDILIQNRIIFLPSLQMKPISPCRYTAYANNMADCRLWWRASKELHLFLLSFIT